MKKQQHTIKLCCKQWTKLQIECRKSLNSQAVWPQSKARQLRDVDCFPCSHAPFHCYPAAGMGE